MSTHERYCLHCWRVVVRGCVFLRRNVRGDDAHFALGVGAMGLWQSSDMATGLPQG